MTGLKDNGSRLNGFGDLGRTGALDVPPERLLRCSI